MNQTVALLSSLTGAAVAATAYGSFWPRSRLFAPVIYHGDRDGPRRIALTFDDGPHPQTTAAVLDVLAAHHVPAAFFVIGANAVGSPDLIRRTDAEGHLVANHSFDHAWTGMFYGRAYWTHQLQRTGDAVEAIIRRRPALFRPPMGFKQPLLAAAARDCRQHIVTWSRRAFDGVPTTPDRIVVRLAHSTRPGDILALHDGCEPHRRQSRHTTVAALRELIPMLRARGFAFTRLDALVGIQGYLNDRGG